MILRLRVSVNDLQWVPRFKAFATGNPFFGDNLGGRSIGDKLLGRSIGKGLGVLQGLRAPRDKSKHALLTTKRSLLQWAIYSLLCGGTRGVGRSILPNGLNWGALESGCPRLLYTPL